MDSSQGDPRGFNNKGFNGRVFDEKQMREEFDKRMEFDRRHELERREEFDRRHDFDRKFPFWWFSSF